VRVVELLGLLFCVEVVQVAEELIETVDGGQVLVLVAEMVFAELAGGIAERLQQLGNGRILGGPTDVGARYADLAHAGAVDALSTDESRTARRAALLTVGVGEAHSLIADTVDVRGAIAHQSVAVAAEVADPDVIAPDH
jgi:hypothetical protein